MYQKSDTTYSFEQTSPLRCTHLRETLSKVFNLEVMLPPANRMSNLYYIRDTLLFPEQSITKPCRLMNQWTFHICKSQIITCVWATMISIIFEQWFNYIIEHIIRPKKQSRRQLHIPHFCRKLAGNLLFRCIAERTKCGLLEVWMIDMIGGFHGWHNDET